MEEAKPSHSITGKTLAEDVYNENGLLLLPAGAVLHPSDIRLLSAHKVKQVFVANDDLIPDPPSPLLHWNEVQAAHEYMAAVQHTEELFIRIATGSIPPLHQFNQVFYPLLDDILQRHGVQRFIYVREGNAQYTYRHSLHVGILSALIGKLMGQSEEQIVFLGQAGLLHDVGKMMIPQEILVKPDSLTDDEYKIMKQHTKLGEYLIRNMDGADEMLALCALLHHERLDGSGYPEGRRQENIPFECQIVSVADVFDAICTDRVYRKGTSPFEAATILSDLAYAGKLNPQIVTPFIHYVIMLYVGTEAYLNSGERVEILLIHTDEPMRPLVRRKGEYLDLRQHRTLQIQSIIE
ncbi:HD-GYP domain-containing protein [Brevibacillus ruminantium]|uniref:HD-GYP domain-containing protein n=1 Tax=Brevibacillus ruminantium TaxID=2950604 RepID=A0ABY4WKX5_9BACL|nr:HD-GYP domain-containing protein [Brevibacillus ruminantium]USG65306.1 HD-GYP domain-containing protein [Brevibacillus ruminantium]